MKGILILSENFRKAEAEEQYCNPKSVVERFLKAIGGEAPESWYIKDEEPLIYTGAVIEKEQMISNLKNFVSRFGFEGTQIKKKLLNKLKESCAE